MPLDPPDSLSGRYFPFDGFVHPPRFPGPVISPRNSKSTHSWCQHRLSSMASHATTAKLEHPGFFTWSSGFYPQYLRRVYFRHSRQKIGVCVMPRAHELSPQQATGNSKLNPLENWFNSCCRILTPASFILTISSPGAWVWHSQRHRFEG